MIGLFKRGVPLPDHVTGSFKQASDPSKIMHGFCGHVDRKQVRGVVDEFFLPVLKPIPTSLEPLSHTQLTQLHAELTSHVSHILDVNEEFHEVIKAATESQATVQRHIGLVH